MHDFMFLLRFWIARPCLLPRPTRRRANVPRAQGLAEEVDNKGKKVGIDWPRRQQLLDHGNSYYFAHAFVLGLFTTFATFSSTVHVRTGAFLFVTCIQMAPKGGKKDGKKGKSKAELEREEVIPVFPLSCALFPFHFVYPTAFMLGIKPLNLDPHGSQRRVLVHYKVDVSVNETA